MNKNEILKKMKPFVGYALFIGMSLVVFFIAAFLVVLLRTSKTAKIVMPDIRERYYMDIHNELMRLGLKVRLKSKRIPEKNDGMILYQSISPGKKITSGSIVYITVNDGVDRVIVPDIKGLLLNNAKARLDKVLSGETYVNLEIGGITYIPADDAKTVGTVIRQFPEAGKKITTREKVYLLVTEIPKTEDPGKKESESDKQGMLDEFKTIPFTIVSTALNKRSKTWKVVETVLTKDRRENGLVSSYTIDSSGGYLFKVFYFQPENRIKSGYEKVEYKIEENDSYRVSVKQIDEPDDKYVNIINDTPYRKDEYLKLVFYREGNVIVSIIGKNGNIEKSYKFKSDI
ncbi:MAG: PASTA domain-containing protein [Leptospiraceae bacterium]|nr:PASTA domain-containing protein [Leptospiraceae bacterium]MCP5495429.1 PASTA domain-containing protein [Leptospiraceae bacterium]